MGQDGFHCLVLAILSFLTFFDVTSASRGCRCYVKTSDNGPNLATHHQRIGGFLSGCNNRQRDICAATCLRWGNSLLGSSAQLTSMCQVHGQQVGPNDCTGEGLRLRVYSKLDCDGTKPYHAWHKQYLQCDRTLCCCKTVVPMCHGQEKVFWDGYICKSTLQNEIPGIKSYHVGKQSGLNQRASSSCTATRPAPPTRRPILGGGIAAHIGRPMQ